MHMIKAEILQKAETEGIELTESMLNRYIKHGFLKAEKKGVVIKILQLQLILKQWKL